MTEPCSDLMDIGAVASALNCTQASARTIIGRSAKTNWPFPSPCIRLGNSPGWAPEDVEAWIAGRPGAGKGPRPGRRLPAEQRMQALAKDRTYLTAGQLAKLLDTPLERLRRLPRAQTPKRTFAGGFIRFELDDIREWLASQDGQERMTG